MQDRADAEATNTETENEQQKPQIHVVADE
jgi:hypothetical protein